MNLRLDPKDQRELEVLASQAGKEPGELLREIVKEGLAERKQNGFASSDDEDAIARAQHEEWKRLKRELSSLPVSEKAAGFSGRDHDEVLYGWKKK